MTTANEILRDARKAVRKKYGRAVGITDVELHVADRCAKAEAERDESDAILAQFLVQDEACAEAHGTLLLEAESLRAEVARLRRGLGLIAIVNQGCGGTLTFREMAESAMSQARDVLNAAREGGSDAA